MKAIKDTHPKSKGIVLFEESIEFPRMIAMSYLAMYWSRSGYDLYSYPVGLKRNSVREMLATIFARIPTKREASVKYRIFKSLSFSGRIRPGSMKLSDEDWMFLSSYIGSSRQRVLELTFRGIHVGENYYDWYLRTYHRTTIDTNSKEFFESLAKFIKLTKWWIEFFDRNIVRAVNISHSTYAQGLMARIAISKNIKCINMSFDKLYSLDSENPYSDCEFQGYEKDSMVFHNYALDLNRSSSKLDQLITGSEFVTREHRIKSGFQDLSIQFNFPNSECKYMSMIASHCFTDAPHQQGTLLFPDFFAWFEFMAKSTQNSEHLWFAKPHPHFTIPEDEAFRLVVAKYPHLIPIPKGVSNLQLFEFGIRSVFTVHGTIAFDAATQGIMSVSASNNTSYKKYNFSIQPKSIEELGEVILNLEKYIDAHLVNKEEVLHYFDLHHLRPMYSWVFRDKLKQISETLGGYSNIFSDLKLLDEWTSTVWTQKYHDENLRSIQEFIESGRYFVHGHDFKSTPLLREPI
jgi:hypothetical protein